MWKNLVKILLVSKWHKSHPIHSTWIPWSPPWCSIEDSTPGTQNLKMLGPTDATSDSRMLPLWNWKWDMRLSSDFYYSATIQRSFSSGYDFSRNIHILERFTHWTTIHHQRKSTVTPCMVNGENKMLKRTKRRMGKIQTNVFLKKGNYWRKFLPEDHPWISPFLPKLEHSPDPMGVSVVQH